MREDPRDTSLIARAIHEGRALRLSARLSRGPYFRMDCAAMCSRGRGTVKS
jgi:hypothetical protein